MEEYTLKHFYIYYTKKYYTKKLTRHKNYLFVLIHTLSINETMRHVKSN